MKLTSYLSYRFFLLANIVLLSCIAIFAIQKFGPLNNKEVLKYFGSRLLYLYLIGCCSAFLAFFYPYFSNKFKNYAWFFIVFIFAGVLGTKLNTYEKIDILHTNKNLIENISLTKDKDLVHARLNFQQPPAKLTEYLKLALKGKLIAKIKPFFLLSGDVKYVMEIGKNKFTNEHGLFVLSTDSINDFLNNKEINFYVTSRKDVLVNLTERDFGVVARNRKDYLWLNERSITLESDKILSVTFLFEDISGKPLAFFV